MTSKDLKVKLRPKHKINLTHNFSYNFFFIAMSNTYFLFKKIPCQKIKNLLKSIFQKLFLHFSFTIFFFFWEFFFLKRKFQHFGKIIIISVKATKLLVDLPRKSLTRKIKRIKGLPPIYWPCLPRQRIYCVLDSFIEYSS
jgi:hypothetical protein